MQFHVSYKGAWAEERSMGVTDEAELPVPPLDPIFWRRLCHKEIPKAVLQAEVTPNDEGNGGSAGLPGWSCACTQPASASPPPQSLHSLGPHHRGPHQLLLPGLDGLSQGTGCATVLCIQFSGQLTAQDWPPHPGLWACHCPAPPALQPVKQLTGSPVPAGCHHPCPSMLLL